MTRTETPSIFTKMQKEAKMYSIKATTGFTTLEAVNHRVEDYVKEKGLSEPVVFDVVWGGNKIAQFTLCPMPGCCGVVVSTDSRKITDVPNFTTAFHALKEAVARDLGYSSMIATTQLRNIPEVVGAAKNGWKHIFSFRNKRTTNDISIMVKGL